MKKIYGCLDDMEWSTRYFNIWIWSWIIFPKYKRNIHPVGQFSLLNNKWIKKPTKEDFTPDEELIKSKASDIMFKIDDMESDLKMTTTMKNYLRKF